LPTALPIALPPALPPKLPPALPPKLPPASNNPNQPNQPYQPDYGKAYSSKSADPAYANNYGSLPPAYPYDRMATITDIAAAQQAAQPAASAASDAATIELCDLAKKAYAKLPEDYNGKYKDLSPVDGTIKFNGSVGKAQQSKETILICMYSKTSNMWYMNSANNPIKFDSIKAKVNFANKDGWKSCIVQGGGGNNNSSYEKYLKYKAKYIALKNSKQYI